MVLIKLGITDILLCSEVYVGQNLANISIFRGQLSNISEWKGCLFVIAKNV